MHARLRGSKSLLTLYQIINKYFPSLADEIAEPHPDMNIKVAAFTVSEKSSNIWSRFCPARFCYITNQLVSNFCQKIKVYCSD